MINFAEEINSFYLRINRINDKIKMTDKITGYELSRNFFDWCFENPELIKPAHIAMYFFIVEHWNRLGQKDKFGLPMEMTKDAIGIKNYKTYASTFNDLVDWNFIKVLQKSKNQYSANVIAIVKNTKATTKALSKASLKHSQKHSQKQVQSIVGIDKPITLEPITLEPGKEDSLSHRQKIIHEWYLRLQNDQLALEAFCKKTNLNEKEFLPAIDFFYITKLPGEKWTDEKDFKQHFLNWSPNYQKEKSNGTHQNTNGGGNSEIKVGRSTLSELERFANAGKKSN